jgi:TctA family transporter
VGNKEQEVKTLRNPHALVLLAREQGWRLVLTEDESELQAHRPQRHGKLLAVAPVSAGVIDSFIAYKLVKKAKKPKKPGRPRSVKAPAAAAPRSTVVPFDAEAVLAEVAEREAA